MLILAAGTKAVAGADNYLAQRSLRFRNSANAYLNRTPASVGNLQTWTWSGWIKRGQLSTKMSLFGADPSSTNDSAIQFLAADTLQFYLWDSSMICDLQTTQVFRDPSAWYHIVVAWDSTQATSSNRVKIYVNGSQITAFGTATYPSLNYNGAINKVGSTYIGVGDNALYPFDGYMTELNFVNGQALTPSSFGATNADTGVWRPKAYTGTYGTNGFYLNFADNSALTTASNVGLGKDNSGNGNYWVTNNISITAGTTYDSMTDVPTNTSATVANYAVLNPLSGGVTPSQANLTIVQAAASWNACASTFIPNTGKWYFEAGASTLSTSNNYHGLGLRPVGMIAAGEYCGSISGSYGAAATSAALIAYSNAVAGSSLSGTYTSSSVFQCAVDYDAGKVWFGNGSSWIGGGDPAAGTSPTYTFTANTSLTPYISGSASSPSVNFGQRPFTYTPPTGYVALNTYNLPTSTIVQGNKYMDATTYTGNGTVTGNTQTITNTSGFQPDLVWVKSRSSGTQWNVLTDAVRGANKLLYSNDTAAEATVTNVLNSFNSNGFTVAYNSTYSSAITNASGSTYVGWQWKASNATGVSNTSGTITSTVSANTTAGFSVVTYTGTGANATVGHGLGVAPSMIIGKSRGAANAWGVYHISVGNTKAMYLNTTAAASVASAAFFNNTSPTSSVFSVGSAVEFNASATTQVAYCFAEIAGFSKFGSYTGNGSTDGTFVYLGFKPKFVLAKRIDTTSDWLIYDTSRDIYNVASNYLLPDSSGAEGTAINFDLLSNGFKCKSATGVNVSAGTYIYMAFAENPYKYSNAR